MAEEDRTAPEEGTVAPTTSLTEATAHVDKVKTIEELQGLPQTPETARRLAVLESGIKIPTDLSKVSNAKAKELAEAGVVEDRDLPSKMYRRKADGFVTRIPNYTFEAYPDYLQEEWDEIDLPTAEPVKGEDNKG